MQGDTVMPVDVWYVFRALGRRHFAVLERLYGGDATFSELSLHVQLRGGGLVFVLSDLLQGGFVERVSRGVYRITDRGRRLVDAVRAGTLWDAIRSVLF